MARTLLALAGLLLLSSAAHSQARELDPRLVALKARVSAVLPKWAQDINLAPRSFAAWDLKLPDGGLARCTGFLDAMGADPEQLMEGMALARPGAKLVGEPKMIQTPSAIEVQVTFEVPGQGYGFIWSQILGLRGETSLSPALFSMQNSKNPAATLEEFEAELEAKNALLRPAYAAHLRYAFGLRTSVKDGVATVTEGPSFPIPKGWKAVEEPTTAMDWTGTGDALLTLDVVSTLQHSADAVIAAATEKKTKVAPDPKDKHDVSFVDGDDQVRLKVIEQDGYLYLLRAQAPVAADKTKLAAFKKAIAPIFAGAKAS